MARIKSIRRYYLLSAREAERCCRGAIALAFRGKQKSEPGSPLNVPDKYRALFKSAGYLAQEDLDGADIDELVEVGISAAIAFEVIGNERDETCDP